MEVASLMTPNPHFVNKQDTIKTALAKMLDLDIRHLPVLDKGKLIGIISDRDIRDYCSPIESDYYSTQDSRASLDAAVGSIMTGAVIAITDNSNVNELLEVMIEGKLSAVPVIDRAEKLVGIISYVDILKYFQATLNE